MKNKHLTSSKLDELIAEAQAMIREPGGREAISEVRAAALRSKGLVTSMQSAVRIAVEISEDNPGVLAFNMFLIPFILGWFAREKHAGGEQVERLDEFGLDADVAQALMLLPGRVGHD